MRRLLATLFLLAASAVSAEAAHERVPLALSASPARVVIPPGGRATIRLTNLGRMVDVVAAAPVGYALDLRGRPLLRAGARAAAVRSLTVRPGRLAVRPGTSAVVVVTAARHVGLAPGDHAVVVLLSARSASGSRVVARLRIGVVVVLHVPGRVVHALQLGAVRARVTRRVIRVDALVLNRGNVDEWIGTARLRVLVRRGGGGSRGCGALPRRLLARTRGVVEVRCGVPGRGRGRLALVVELVRPRPGVAVLRRSLRLRV